MTTAYERWDTSANATVLRAVNVYSLSRPLNLLIPHFVILLVSLLSVVLGCIGLIKNGVFAVDGSFMQIVTTSTGSSILHKAAAGGSLGEMKACLRSSKI